MKATILDTQTGKKAVADGQRSWDWAYGNWSCDCNRENYFDVPVSEAGTCLGTHRYIVIAAEFNSSDDYEYPLVELNRGYPAELLKQHGIEV